MSFTVDKEIPLEDKRKIRSECPYPFKEMSIGDSFEVATEDHAEFQRQRAAVHQWVRRYRNASGIRSFSVSTRVTDSGFRVWRIS